MESSANKGRIDHNVYGCEYRASFHSFQLKLCLKYLQSTAIGYIFLALHSCLEYSILGCSRSIILWFLSEEFLIVVVKIERTNIHVNLNHERIK